MEETAEFRMECVIQPGDSIEAIALAFDTTPEILQKENPHVDVYHLIPEQVLQFPFPMRCSGQIYIARRGDTLASIARQFRISEEVILRENPFLRILGVVPAFPFASRHRNLRLVAAASSIPSFPETLCTHLLYVITRPSMPSSEPTRDSIPISCL